MFIEVEDEANGEGRESQGSWLRFLEYGEGSTQRDDNNETTSWQNAFGRFFPTKMLVVSIMA